MICNLIIILFLGIMALIWGNYGLFSAFLHLVVTIASAALALALWEPIVYGILIHRMPNYAWGVGLLGPFVLWLIVLRTVVDKVVLTNLDFNQITNVIAGGFVGLLSAILITGLTVIGAGFLPLEPSLLGYQPLVVTESGNVDRNSGGQLWFPVDRWTARFFERLSSGSLYSGKPMRQYMPDLHERHALFRMAVDPNASPSATPESVQITQMYVHSLPLTATTSDVMVEALAPPEDAEGPSQVVMIETEVAHQVPPYDGDGFLRMSPSQVRLISSHRDRRRGQVTVSDAPRGIVIVDPVGTQRQFLPVNARDVSADSSHRPQTLGWVFVISEGQIPTYLMFRQLRLAVPKMADAETALDVVEISLGDAQRKRTVGRDGEQPLDLGRNRPTFDQRRGARVGSQPVQLELTAQLPKWINKNKAHLQLNQDNKVVSGTSEVKPQRFGQVKKSDRVYEFFVPDTQAMVRIRLSREQAQSLLGGARQLAAEVAGVIHLTDTNGQTYQADAYVWLQRDSTQHISRKAGQPIRSASELPTRRLQQGDELYLYFTVTSGVTIDQYNVGQTKWKIRPTVAR